MDPEAALAICRFLRAGAAMALWGAFVFLWAFVPKALADLIGQRLSIPRISAIAVVLLASFATMPLEAAVIANGWPDALDRETGRAVLFDTSVGPGLIAQVAAALLLAATLASPPRLRFGATALASGLVLASLALTGHATMQAGAPGLAHRLNDGVHVLAGGAWLGGLIALLPLLPALDDSARRQEAGVALRRFSWVGHGVVAIVLVTGLLNSALVLGRWPTTWGSPYQAMLAAKVALVIAMTLLAIFNRYVVVPRMAGDRSGAIGNLRRATVVEIVLGFGAIGLVSVFGLLDPA